MITEAMKMETTVQAPFDGVIKQVHVSNGDGIQPGDLLIELES
ncbi:MAG: biotin/lipoyl-containing protein [Priestia megaterium]